MKIETLRRAIKRYGKLSQVDKSIEEMSELTKSLLKERYSGIWRAGEEEGKRDKVVEEIADVLLLMEQLQEIYSCREEVESIQAQKLLRLEEELNKIDLNKLAG